MLDQEQPTTRSTLVSKIWGLLETKAVPITVNHYNALLRVHLENGHQFAPEEVPVDKILLNFEVPCKTPFRYLRT